MYGSVNLKNKAIDSMDQSDIKDIIGLLNDGIFNKDWDVVEEAREALKEFIDSPEPPEDEYNTWLHFFWLQV